MTKGQKSLFKKAKTNAHRDGFVEMLMAQQAQMGGFAGWQLAYAKKCKRKGAEAPFPLSDIPET
jgi:hypothetical protein